MPVEPAAAIVPCAFARHLAAGGAFHRFTYVPRCPNPARYLEAMRIRAVRLGIAWMNFPPAIVYRFERRIEAVGHHRSGARPPSEMVAEAPALHGLDTTRFPRTPSLDSSGAGQSSDGSPSSS